MTVPVAPTFEEFIAPLEDLPVHERAIIRRAFELAQRVHAGQKRKSGEDYVVHCIEVARILMDLGLDAAAIAAGLLHDTVEDTPVTLDELEEEFGEEIAKLVAGVTKLDKIALGSDNTPKGKPRDREAEYLRKTLLAMDDDVRVILIKLADRLHNMRTLGHLSRERQISVAQETMDIFAPLASRLGIWQLKWELEDLAFRYLEPERYRMIARLIDERRSDRDYYVSKVVEKLSNILKQHNIQADISGRSKHIYSIWQKMERKGLPFDQIFDVRAVRIIVPDVFTCYQVLAIIHQTWRPIAGEFDDYIAAPKENFYQSLHTAVILEDGKTLEVQIRTPEMHAAAEYGIAAHWRYKEANGKGGDLDRMFELRIQHLRKLMEVGRGVDDADEFLDTMRSDVLRDRVYVFTPRGDIIDLPAGSTPIDFAYHVHTDIGHRCRGAKVDGKLVPLDYTLQVGDRVEILTAKRGGPSRDWLNPQLGYVKTKRAASKIRHWFRRQDRDKMIALGRDILDREMKKLGVEKMSHEQVATLFGLSNVDDLLAQIGFGDIHPQHIATKILDAEREEQEETLPIKKTPVEHGPLGAQEIKIHGTGGLLTNLARCCSPVQGEDVIGYVTRGRGVTIHRRDCRNVLNLDPERLIEVDWGDEPEARYHVPVIIRAFDREGLMRDIGAAVADEHINMSNVNIRTENYMAIFEVTMEVESAAQLSNILSRIARLPNVIEARRVVS
ncbi:MAG: bifunctional (p)ppGpp synthetase/guanosine-3',5'-bis(diphosphate) 3'-pyrophosphohydrolase [Aggregatilineales bacterium]|jgi:GTP pyrophosphokinase|nr:bifunctional (p)ppGpp synthetase/guanosine-3',5'-bis(diphosphate) 3'-pyrophosphohydrolase [Chloroflexota bacterium]HOA22853.1 bifunctional (p)ppGpp synthetase/guanosine-3',5'-bis(diphosphate) 3'-pyrophosphohydrolase [Aggregatilineales bacterium]HPV05800.1 bifunctional (p)ppGpp synthetase/guanosine-3',5'-bis(diphosphate) 3'-pyrophosphohydrolase [Aggregatilineales bacterium]